MDSPSESESELEDDGTRASYKVDETVFKLEGLSKLVSNPEKGYYLPEEFHITKKNDIPRASDYKFNSFSKDRPDIGHRLVFIQFYLEAFRTDRLSNDLVTFVSGILDNVRSANKKAIIRFSYSDQTTGVIEPKSSLILEHIKQLTPTLQAHTDIIYVLQAGFIGTWGEWFYTTETNTNLKSQSNDFDKRREIVNAMLKAVPNRVVALRTPRFKQLYFNKDNKYNALSYPNTIGTESSNANGRLGFYNDVFMKGGYEESGTFRQGKIDKAMWEQQSAFVPAGGEPANEGSTSQSVIDNLKDAKNGILARINKDHLSYLHYRTDRYSFGTKEWKNNLFIALRDKGMLNSVANTLGYRLWLTRFSTKGTYKAGGKINITFALKNNGSAPVMYERPMKLLLLDNYGKVKQVLASTEAKDSYHLYFTEKNGNNYTKDYSQPADIRKIAPGKYKYMTCEVTLSKTVQKNDRIALWMPDSNTQLQGIAEYSIKLCNKQDGSGGVIWKKGFNPAYNIIYTFNSL